MQRAGLWNGDALVAHAVHGAENDEVIRINCARAKRQKKDRDDSHMAAAAALNACCLAIATLIPRG